MHELRCDNRILFGTIQGNVLEVRCRSRRCGKEDGVIIIHRFALQDGPEDSFKTGDLVGTLKFRDADPKYRKESDHAAGKHPAIRTA